MVPYDPPMVPEALLEQTGAGLAPAGEGWFVLNAPFRHWTKRDFRMAWLP
jgi:hypothetical protein